jgi:hypothetical protein
MIAAGTTRKFRVGRAAIGVLALAAVWCAGIGTVSMRLAPEELYGTAAEITLYSTLPIITIAGIAVGVTNATLSEARAWVISLLLLALVMVAYLLMLLDAVRSWS